LELGRGGESVEEEQGREEGEKKQWSKFRNIVYLEAPYIASVFSVLA